MLEKLYDNRRSDSWATKLREKRLSLLKSLIASVPTPLKILDIGGRQAFWENTAFLNQELKGLEITLLNLDPESVSFIAYGGW